MDNKESFLTHRTNPYRNKKRITGSQAITYMDGGILEGLTVVFCWIILILLNLRLIAHIRLIQASIEARLAHFPTAVQSILESYIPALPSEREGWICGGWHEALREEEQEEPTTQKTAYALWDVFRTIQALLQIHLPSRLFMG